MNASELFQAGQLNAAIDAQVQKVKAHPADQSARFFLFELLLFYGDIDRARKQLDVLNYEKPEALAAVAAFRKALDAESERRRVLAGQGRPKFLLDVPAHADLRLEAILRYAEGNSAAGDELVDKANEGAPLVTGTLNGEAVADLRDADDLFGSVLEVFANNEYCWVPVEQVESLTMNPVANPRDVIWRAANLAMKDGPQGDVLLPGLYAGSQTHADDAIRLGRVTDWSADEDRPNRGFGGKLFVAGEKWISLTDWQAWQGPATP